MARNVLRNIGIILLLLFIVGLAIRLDMWINCRNYRMTCYVSGTDGTNIRFTDYATENDWWWTEEGNREWHMWENATLTMDDHGTTDITDDSIVRVK